jgi:hypothetical protein
MMQGGSLWRVHESHCQKILCVFLIVQLAQAAPGGSLAQLTGSASFVKPDKQHWSPLQGALAHQTNVLKALYASEVQAGQDLSAMARFLKEFYFVGDNDQVTMVTAHNLFGSSAQVGDVTLMAHLVEAKQIEQVLNAKKLKDFISSKKIKSLDDLRKRLSVGTPQKNLTDLIEAVQPHTMQELQEKLDAYEKKLGEGDMRKKRTVVLGKLQNALGECSGDQRRYAPYTPHTILMGFLVSKAAQRGSQTAREYREAIADYFDGMRDLGTPITTEAYRRELFLAEPLYAESQETIETLLKRLKEQYIHNSFSFNDFLRDGYEDMAVLGILQRRYQLIHPLPDYAHVTLTVGDARITFGDCVEASVLGFLNELWFNPHEQRLALPAGVLRAQQDVSGSVGTPLPSSAHQASCAVHDFLLAPEVKEFYIRFFPPERKDVTRYYSDDVHRAWAGLWAQRADLPITYNTKLHDQLCEVDSTPANAVALLAHSLGMPEPQGSLTLAGLLTFFSAVTEQINALNEIHQCDKKITLQKITIEKVDAAGQKQTQIISLEDGVHRTQALAEIPELQQVLRMSSSAQDSSCKSIALTFLAQTASSKQQFSWYIEPKHSWFGVCPLDRAQNAIRTQIAQALPGFDQKLMAAIDERDVRTTNLAEVYSNHEELSTLAAKLSSAGLVNFCWTQPVHELMVILEELKNKRTLPQADLVVCAITKIALASEDLEAFISTCLAVLTAPAWSPTEPGNNEFWQQLMCETFPAKHAQYNKTLMQQILCCDENRPEGRRLLELLFNKVVQEKSNETLFSVFVDEVLRRKKDVLYAEILKIIQK